MKIVNPNDASHVITCITRKESSDGQLILFNETTKEETAIVSVMSLINGFTELLFNFDFAEGQKFQFKIIESDGFVNYRGKLFATSQETQNYQQSKDLYRYEQ